MEIANQDQVNIYFKRIDISISINNFGDITNIEVLLLMLILIHIDLELVVIQFSYLQVFFLLFLLVTPEEDSGVTGEKQIADLIM